MTLLRKEIYANAMQNECTLGGGDNGYLSIIMPTIEYITEQTKNGVQIPIGFIRPQPPDPALAADVVRRTKSIRWKHI